jgi:hypothetical protein
VLNQKKFEIAKANNKPSELVYHWYARFEFLEGDVELNDEEDEYQGA